MEPYETHLALGTAIAVGLLVGMERERSRPEATGSLFAGVRTYPIIALIGALATILEPTSMWLPLIALGGLITLLAISYAADIRNGRAHGVTTETSTVATYLLGALAASRGVVEPLSTRLGLVAALGVTLTFLLSSKPSFHALASKISRDDFYATVKFLIVAVIVLPLLPDHAIGPLDAINPFQLGVIVVMISGLSFLGYVAMRLLGARRGLLVGAVLGSLVSSTAVTLSLAGRTREQHELAPAAAGAIAIAWTIMIARVTVLIAIVAPALLPRLAVPLLTTGAGAILGALLTFRRADAGNTAVMSLNNPFELGTAIKFGLVFGGILLASKAALVYLGDRGFYLASALGGTTDVDAVTLSTARLVHGGLAHDVAAVAVVIAILSNTAIKAGLAAGVGGKALGKRTSITGGLIVAGGALGLAIMALG